MQDYFSLTGLLNEFKYTKLDKSRLSATQDNKTIDDNNAPLDKDNRESTDDNSCNSNECNKILDQELSNSIANDNSKNHSR